MLSGQRAGKGRAAEGGILEAGECSPVSSGTIKPGTTLVYISDTHRVEGELWFPKSRDVFGYICPYLPNSEREKWVLSSVICMGSKRNNDLVIGST